MMRMRYTARGAMRDLASRRASAPGLIHSSDRPGADAHRLAKDISFETVRSLLIVVAVGSALLTLNDAAVAAAKTTIALTATRIAEADVADRKLTESLSALLELQLLNDDGLAIVERQQIDLALQELALSRSRSAEDSLQLGKLATADLLVMLELRRPDKDSSKPSALLRIVAAKTAAIRGITVATDVDETSIEDIAEQFGRYVSSVVREPDAPAITVAVAPFESVGRFDRLRPLELGLRDLVTARLMALRSPVAPRQESQTSSRSDRADDPSDAKPAPAVLSRSDRATFQVLQRSNLEHLLRELDLIQSGFADKDRLPSTLPDREAAFLIKGEIDERQADGKFTIIVRGELQHAATRKTRDSFEFECPPIELESQLAARVDAFAKHFGVNPLISRNALASGSGNASTSQPDASAFRLMSVGHEADSLKTLALRDLHRFRRQCPIDFSHRAFAMPGEPWLRNVPRLVQPETPLGLALLRKSIDRLETSLFIDPDDAESAYALGFCFSIHQPGIYRPDRADELLRSAAARKPGSPLAACSLTILSELAFDDRSGALDAGQSEAAAERLWLAFESMPVEFRDRRWPRMLELFGRLKQSPEQMGQLLAKVIPFAEQSEETHRPVLASEVRSLAVRLAARAKQNPALKGQAIESLRRWADGAQVELADFGRQGLAAIHEASGEFLEAAKLYETSAAALAGATTDQDQHKRQVQWIKAATNYRRAKQPERGLQLLRSFEPQTTLTNSYLVGLHGYEVAACHEALGDPQAALAEYLQAAEKSPGIVMNSDLVERVTKLGGVPLRDDREIDVTYLLRDQRPVWGQRLATDGRRLFVGGVGVWAFDPDKQTWRDLKSGLTGVLCLQVHDGRLWVGTTANGLWRCDLDTERWTSFGIEQGLPDVRVASLAFRENEVFAGVGTPAAGGLVRIDEHGAVHLFREPLAPSVTPTHLVETDQELLARTLKTIHKWSWESKTWTLHPDEPKRPVEITSHLFAGTSGVWTSNYGRELSRWNADIQLNQAFKPAWYFSPGRKAGYHVHFVAERGDEVWFGGQQWEHFTSSGLYRFHLKTGSFHKFAPSDGFKSIHAHSISDGLWLRDRLWLATSSGLCEVTPREKLPATLRDENERKTP